MPIAVRLRPTRVARVLSSSADLACLPGASLPLPGLEQEFYAVMQGILGKRASPYLIDEKAAMGTRIALKYIEMPWVLNPHAMPEGRTEN